MSKITDLHKEALEYHNYPQPGKVALRLTTPSKTADDLSLAYSPGVAAPCLEIEKDEENAYKYTSKGNLVAVISNGTAVLGLGNLGALGAKPVMEGKSLLFKRFAGVDSVDVEVDTEDKDEFVQCVRLISKTYGGINLEDIKAPECFQIEKQLKAACNIPIMHDDQHGTAIVTVAGMLNALDVQGKDIATSVFVCLGAGSAAIACMSLLISAGATKSNIYMLDRNGVLRTSRTDMNEYKQQFAVDRDDIVTLEDAIKNADVFLGLSGANLLTAEQLKKMAPNPIVFACANPNPEIAYDTAVSTRDDVIMATGRSDYPNQVNNVLGFPFIFRGALDVRATDINEEMKLAAAHAIRKLAQEPVPEAVLTAYGLKELKYGKDYIIPKPMDSRLLGTVSAAVAKAAVETGVARLPYPTHYPLKTVHDIFPHAVSDDSVGH
eukprot:m.9126 g.9126  ORF g.9126 m.9126 type:complete len:436 (-) comp6846_c0_seq2:3750-5057(-)